MTTTTIDTKDATTIPATTATTTEPGHAGQTFLVGEEIYVRRIEKADARYAMSWRDSIFPRSPSVTEEWITKEMMKSGRDWYAIVRKADDRPVGSLTLSGHGIHTFLRFHVDPLYGEAAGRWKAEAIRLVLPWRSDEQKKISQFLTLTGDETEAIAAALDAGAFEAARTPKLILKEGERVDLVRFAHLSPAWIAKLGDPRETNLVRTGTGDPRPVPARGTWDGDPPKGAILVGQRVYLKAVDKEDAAAMARFGRREIETDYGHFRAVNNAENMAHRRLEDNGQRFRYDVGFAVRLRENDHFIGEVAVLGVDYVSQWGETASWMYDPAFRGNGYGSEAKHLLLEYCFDVLGLRAVASSVSTDNPRSAAALRKQGYLEAGVIPWVEMDNGRFSGDVIFHLTAERWRSLPRAASTTSQEDTP
ncbi:MAG TPA: GNAT family protein [Thermomicrobiales bacterium]|nr:GNAT family protein [Thermomicrobiales bacterium]